MADIPVYRPIFKTMAVTAIAGILLLLLDAAADTSTIAAVMLLALLLAAVADTSTLVVAGPACRERRMV